MPAPTTVRRMQDRAVVAAVVAGDADGFGAAYDQYAASLYAYCHVMLSEPEAAAEAVLDTFLIAAARLAELRDPDRLGPWLHAVARNECLCRLGPEYAAGRAEFPGPADPDDVPAAAHVAGPIPGQGADGLRQQLPDRPGVSDKRGASRGFVRPGRFPEGDRPVLAAMGAACPAAPRPGRGGSRDGGPGHDDGDHGDHDGGRFARPAGRRPRAGRRRARGGIQRGPGQRERTAFPGG